MIFCTLFNQAYLPQGLALYRSLERTAKDGFLLYVLCMDRKTAAVLEQLAFPSLRIIPLEDIETEGMKALKAQRSVGEYCWTCTTPLLLHVLGRCEPGAVVTYVDADIAFFSDPSIIVTELGSGSIYIHEHDFARRYADLEAVSGQFNVGVSAFRNDAEGRACLELWKSQCFDECVMDFDAGKCGDQNYLDEWPKLYPSLVISANPGVGLGPWNIESRKISGTGSHLLINGQQAVFYHYHSLKLLKPNWGIKVIWLSGWFEIPAAAVSAFYHPYARELWRAVADIERNGFKIGQTMSIVPDKVEDMPFQQTVMAQGRIIIPSFLSGWFFKLLSSGARRKARRYRDS